MFTSVYDNDGRLTKLTNPEGEVTSFSFDAAGQNTVKDLDNGTRAQMTFDAAGNLALVVNLNSASTTLTSFAYGFDCVGDRTGVVEANGNYSNWKYDGIAQHGADHYYSAWSWNTLSLPQWEIATADDWYPLPVDAMFAACSHSYVYDSTGNLTAQVDPDTGDVVTTNIYDNSNRLITAEEAAGITTYSYDNNGNQSSIEEPGGDITTNTWDGENRLVQVEHPDFTITSYVYDASGHRIEKDDGVDVTRFLYDGNNVVQERDDLGSVEAEFTYVPAAYAQVVSQHRDSQSNFYAFDGIANTVALTDDAEVVTDEYAHSAWGEQCSSTGSTANSQIYKGQFLAYYNDPNAGPETSTYTTHHRNYSAKQKQFTSNDPSESDINSSRYVKNNPINKVDPSGLEEIQTGSPSRAAFIVPDYKPVTQPISFDQISIKEMMTSLLGPVHGPGFLESQGKMAANRVIDLMTAGWKVKFSHNSTSKGTGYHIDAPSHVLTIETGYTKETLIPGEGALTISKSIVFGDLTIYKNLSRAIHDKRMTKGGYGAATESSLAAGASSFASHPNVRIISGTLEIAGAAAIISVTGGGALPIIIAGYSGIRGLENVGSGVIESATGYQPRNLSNQLVDLATGDKETTDNIFFITDLGVAVIDTASGARLFLKKSATKGAANLADETQDVVGFVDDVVAPLEAPYSHLKDHPSVGAGKKFTQSQKKKILAENRKRNNGVLRDDRTGELGVQPKQSKKGVTPPDNEMHIDHVTPRSKGGANSFKNAEVRLRKHNLQKGDKLE